MRWMTGRWGVAAVTAVMVLPGWADARVLPMRGRVVLDTVALRRPAWKHDGRVAVGHVPSERNLLGLERAHRYGLPTAASAGRAATINVAVLRVQFPQEVPDDPRSTGNGRMDLRNAAGDSTVAEQIINEEGKGHLFEMPPHNRAFFDTVVGTMARYYNSISNGNITVNRTVFPLASDSAYTVDSSICYYGLLPPNAGLAYFLIDAVQKADTDPDIVFSDYDAVMIYHAGSDGQHDFSPVTPTPCDLFTAFVRLLDTSLFIPVDGGAAFVEEGVVLPETASQDNRATSLNGVTAHEFGHQLGLLDIYSTRTFFTQVGDFSLMDNDAQQYGIDFGVPGWRTSTLFDLLPVYPDAWSRAYIGAVVPQTVSLDSVREYIVSVAEGTTTNNQVFKVPISAKEYYLIEFRSPDQDVNTLPGVPGDQGVGVRFDSTFNLVMGPARCNPQDLGAIDTCRELGRDYDFQFFYPGETGGMLIWHVDEEVLYQAVPEIQGDPYLINNYQANSAQWNRFRRFLEMEEADGLVNFGGNYYTYFGGQQELFRGSGNHEFGRGTNPSTRSHTGAESFLRIFDISDVVFPTPSFPLHHMTFKVANERAAIGWPQPSGYMEAPQLCVIDGGGRDTVLASSGRYVLGWKHDGTALLNQLPGDSAFAVLRRYDDSLQVQVLAGWARADTTLATPPSVGTDSVGNARWVSAVDVNGKLYIWNFSDGDADGWADSVFAYDLGEAAPRPPLWYDADGDGVEGMFVASANGQALWWDAGTASPYALSSATVHDWALARRDSAWAVYATGDTRIEQAYPYVQGNGRELGAVYSSLVAMDGDRDGNDELIARSKNRLQRLLPHANQAVTVADHADVWQALHGPLSSGDHDGNGLPSVFVGAGEYLAGYQPNLTLETNFPLRGNDLYTANPVCEGVTLDAQVLFGGADGEVQGYLASGEFADGWPFFAGDTVASVAAVAVAPESTVILARSTNGYVWGRQFAGDAHATGSWSQSRSDAARTQRWNSATVPQPAPGANPRTDEPVFAYPNPAPRGMVTIRYYLTESSEVEITVYDLAGNEVTSHNASGTGGMDNEWTWNASSIAPGLYYCRVQSSQGGKEVVEFCKVAISP